MCFSPEVSFITSGGLGVFGIASMRIARGTRKLIAAVPLIFAAQQVFEGVQWVTLRAGNASPSAAYWFLFFALLFWPIYLPLAVYALDRDRRALMRWFILLGVAVTSYFIYMLFTFGVGVAVVEQSIQYRLTEFFGWNGALVYFLAVAGPLFLSSIVAFRLFGALVFVFALLTYFFYSATFVSVWCFFAAVLSGLIVLYLYRVRTLIERV